MGLSRDTIESLVTSRQDSIKKWSPNTIDWPVVMWSAAGFIFLEGFNPIMEKAGKLANDKAVFGRLADCCQVRQLFNSTLPSTKRRKSVLNTFVWL